MRIQTLFRNLDKSEALEAYLQEKVFASTEQFLKYEPNAKVMVRVDQDRHRTQNRKPSFICEILVNSPRSKQTIKVTKGGEDIHTAVNEASLALRNILGRRADMKAKHRRSEYAHEVRNLQWQEQDQVA